MASSPSSSSAAQSRPLLQAHGGGQEEEAAPAAAMALAAPSAGDQHQRQEVMRRWAEMMLCCGGDCGWALQLWRRVVLRKWLNVGAGAGDSDFSADEGESDHEGNEMEILPYRLRGGKSETIHSQCIDARELRICVGTWNVGGRVPPSDLDIQEWLQMEEPADIYVLGFQEVVPLNPGNIFGAEDNLPIAIWERIIRETLNKNCPNKPSHSDPPSPSKFNSSDYLVREDEALIGSGNGSDGELQPLIEQGSNTVVNDSGACVEKYKKSSSASNERVNKGKDFSTAPSIKTSDQSHNLSYRTSISDMEEPRNHNKLPQMLSHTERIRTIWPEEPLDMLDHLDDSTSYTPVKIPTDSLSSKSIHEDFNGFPEHNLGHDISTDNRVGKRKRPYFVRIISKQMVGIFLSIWVRRGLCRYIHNLRVSTVGVGAMGYFGNKGSISISMSIHQTSFCFVCCHLTSGEMDEYLTKRNADVREILRKTVFNPLHGVGMPKGIHDHERIIWLGDLNYRIDLSYKRTHELISKQDWDGLLDEDQLKKELQKGHIFDGWVEGVISFPPTYKYEFNSESYASDEPKSARRRPAWCDRILSYGKGVKLVSYKRVELNISDHRPVTAIYMAEVEVLCHRKSQSTLTPIDAEVENHRLLNEVTIS